MGDTIAGIQDDAGSAARSIERKDGLDGDVKGRGVEGLEHDLSHFFAISLWIEGSLCEEDGVFLGSNTKFVVKSVVPDFFHVIPVGDDTVFDGVLEGEDATF